MIINILGHIFDHYFLQHITPIIITKGDVQRDYNIRMDEYPFKTFIDVSFKIILKDTNQTHIIVGYSGQIKHKEIEQPKELDAFINGLELNLINTKNSLIGAWMDGFNISKPFSLDLPPVNFDSFN